MEDEWLPQNEYESSEEEVDIDEVKKELFEKVQNIKQTLSENFNIDILKNNLRYMKDNIKLKNYQVIYLYICLFYLYFYFYFYFFFFFKKLNN